MHARHAISSITSCLFIAASLAAQEAPPDPRAVQPERPTVATHAHTVAPGYAELEIGVQGNHVDAGRAGIVPTVLKIGLSSHVQLNLGTTGFVSGAGQASGLGDLGVGIKWRLLDDHAVLGDFALLPAITFPTGSFADGKGAGAVSVGMTAISSHEIGPVALDLNAGLTRVLEADGRDAANTALWTVSLGFPVAGRLSWVAEAFGFPTIDGSDTKSTTSFLTGPTFLVSPALNLDLGVIVPLYGDMPNALYAGLVWNLGSLLPRGTTPAKFRPR